MPSKKKTNKKRSTAKPGSTLLNTKLINETQMNLVARIIKMFKGRKIVARHELREAHMKLEGKKASPYFISKNLAAKIAPNPKKEIPFGAYDLGVFKLAKGSKPAKRVQTRKGATPKKVAA